MATQTKQHPQTEAKAKEQPKTPPQAPYQMSHGQGQVKNPDQDKRLKENRH